MPALDFFTKSAAELWRDWTTDGVPSSGKWKPRKVDIRQWGKEIQDLINVVYGASLGNIGGNRHEFAAWDPGRPASGEEIASYPVTIPITIPAGFAQSRAMARDAATANAVFLVQKALNASPDTYVTIGTITFLAGTKVGVFALASDVTFAVGDTVSVVAPNPRDETLARVRIAIVSFHA